MFKGDHQDTKSRDGAMELLAELRRELELIPGGRKIDQCIQCGTCTGSCPVSYAMDCTPRRTIALIKAGDVGSIVQSNTIWLCASCYACTVRCPSGVKVTDIMYALKRVALRRSIRAGRTPVGALSSAFLRIVNKYGRNSEVRLILKYALKTNPFKLVSSIPVGLRLRLKGRLPISQSRVRGAKRFASLGRPVEAGRSGHAVTTA